MERDATFSILDSVRQRSDALEAELHWHSLAREEHDWSVTFVWPERSSVALQQTIDSTRSISGVEEEEMDVVEHPVHSRGNLDMEPCFRTSKRSEAIEVVVLDGFVRLSVELRR